MAKGTIVDATIISAPSSTKNADKARDPDMHQTKKGNQWYFGMKAHIGVDSRTKIIHAVVATAASTAGVRTKIKLADKRAALMDLAKLIQMIGPERFEHTGPGGGAIQHEHKYAHVVLNPRDMTPKQRAALKAVLLSIERGEDDEEADDGSGDQAG